MLASIVHPEIPPLFYENSKKQKLRKTKKNPPIKYKSSNQKKHKDTNRTRNKVS